MAKKVAIGAVLLVGALIIWQTTSEPDSRERRQSAAPPSVVGTTRVRERSEPDRDPTRDGNAAAARPSTPAVVAPAIVGRVYDAETREPFAGAGVLLTPRNGTLPTVTKTGADGLYRFTALDPGEYRVERVFQDEGLPRFNSRDARTITLAEDQIAQGVDFAVSMGLRVSGFVVDGDGNPVPGAEVAAGSPDGQPSVQTATSDENGRFEVVGLGQTRDLTLEAAKVKDGLVSPVFGPEILTPEGLSDVVLTLLPACSVSGRVVDPEGRPLSNVQLSLGVRPQRHLGRGSDVTAEDGSFHIAGLAAGEYEALLLPGEDARRIVYSRAKGPYATFTLEPGQEIEGATLILDAPEAPGIAGRVVDESNDPIADAEIDFLSPAGHAGVSARSDSEGRFGGFGLKDGDYTLRVTHKRYSTVSVEKIRKGSDSVEVVMPPCGILEGRVFDGETDEAVTEFEILYLDDYNRYFVGAEREFAKTRSAEGEFRIDKVHAGPVTVVVRASGYAEARVEVPRVDPRAMVSGLEFALRQGASVSGTVLDPSGNPVAGAAIIPGELPRSESPEVTATARTDASGEFLLADLPADVRVLYAFHVDYATGSAAVTLAPGEQASATILLPSGGTVQGTVFHDGRPWAGQHVRLYAGPARRDVETTTSAAGTYRCENVDLGPASAIAIGAFDYEEPTRRGRWITETITVESGGVVTMDFHFAPGTAAVEGKLTEHGIPVPGANLQLYLGGSSARELRHFRIEQDGSFRFEKVPPGPASLFISIRDGRYRRVEFEIPPNGPLQKNVELAGGLSISGVVTGGSEGDLATFRVAAFKDAAMVDRGASVESLRAAFHQLMAKVKVDAGGRFVVEGLPEGTYTLVATSWDLWAGSEHKTPLRTGSTTARAGQTQPVRLVLGE